MALARSRVCIFPPASVLIGLSLAFFIWILAPQAQAAPLAISPLAQSPTPSLPSSRIQGSSSPKHLSLDDLGTDETVLIDGSNEMTAINQALKERFEADFPEVEVTLQTNGTDAALEALLNNEIDLAAIGRPLTSEEKAKGLIEVPVSQDAISIIIGRHNRFDGHLTLEQFAQIFRGEITNWADVGGAARPIRFIDRPLSSDTRLILSQYGILGTLEQAQGDNVVRVDSDDTAEVIRLLGVDGISYAIASQVKNQAKVKLVKIAVLLDTLPSESAYPYTQVRGYAYRRDKAAVVQPFVGFANGDDGQAAVAEAKQAEARAVSQALQPSVFQRKSSYTAADVPSGYDTPVWLWGLLPLSILLLFFARQYSPVAEAGEDSALMDDASQVERAVETSTPTATTDASDAAVSDADISSNDASAPPADSSTDTTPSNATPSDTKADTEPPGNILPGDSKLSTATTTDVSEASGDVVPVSDDAAMAAETDVNAAQTSEDADGTTSQSTATETIDSTAVETIERRDARGVSETLESSNVTQISEPGSIVDGNQDEPPSAVADVPAILPANDDEGVSGPNLRDPNRTAQEYYVQGQACLESEQDNDALAAFEQAILLDDEGMLAWIAKGTTLLRLGRYEEAIACFDRATPWLQEQDIDLVPGGLLFIATTWINRGQANLKVRQAAAALTDFDYALQLNNGLVEAWMGRGDALMLLGRSSEGEACYAQAKTLRTASEASSSPSTVLMDSGTGDEAEDAIAPLLSRRLTVQSQSDSYILDQAQMAKLQTPNNSTQLSPGSYLLRIHSGSFSYWTDNPRFDPEPWLVLHLHGGRVVNKSTNVEVGTTWVTLNGYDDVLKLQVLETITLCALFMDTYKADNSGQITLSVLKTD